MVRRTSNAEAGEGTTRFLANFSDLLNFVIPQPELCGHLITKATRTAKICGCPVRYRDLSSSLSTATECVFENCTQESRMKPSIIGMHSSSIFASCSRGKRSYQDSSQSCGRPHGYCVLWR
jgi:hypothetical protein